MAIEGPEPTRVGLRDLRHRTGEIIESVKQGRLVYVTERGQAVARITPLSGEDESGVLGLLLASGEARRASNPGYLPARRLRLTGDALSADLEASRDVGPAADVESA